MAVVVAVAAWLVTSPVWAATSLHASDRAGPQSVQGAQGEAPPPTSRAAPQCDQRGATTFGPTPALDPPNASIDVGLAGDCDCAQWLRSNAYEEGRTSTPNSTATISDAVLAARQSVQRAPFVRSSAFRAVDDQGALGVKHPLERPPRS